MPELPEVEAFKEYVKNTSTNKKISDIKSASKRLIKKITFDDFKKTLKNKKIKSPKRKGKYLVIPLSDSKNKIIMHFGLTGSLKYTDDRDEKVKYAQVSFIFSDGSVLHWINKRKFGNMWLIEDVSELNNLKKLGKNPLKISQKEFTKLLEDHSRKNIKSFLMDQEILAGIGNEYSDEILFQAGIDPRRKAHDLSDNEIKTLYKKMQDILNYAINVRVKNIKNMDKKDYFSPEDTDFKSSYLQAHRHSDKKCPKNKNHSLKKEKIAGRSSYFCPKDQK